MADVVLTVTIPDAHVARAVAAINAVDSMKTTLRMTNGVDTVYKYSFDLPAKGADTNKVYGQNIIIAILKGLFKGVEEGTDTDRYNAAVAAIPPITQDVPEGIIV